MKGVFDVGSINRVTVMGNVGKDPEIRSTSGGTRIATLSVATSEIWKDKNSGERKERTEWHRVTVWPDHTVGLIERYVRKGDMILIEGSLETRKWTDQQGQDRYSTEIVVRPFSGGVTLIGRLERAGGGDRLRDRASTDEGYAGGSPGRSNGVAGGRGRNDDLDSEIPF